MTYAEALTLARNEATRTGVAHTIYNRAEWPTQKYQVCPLGSKPEGYSATCTKFPR